MAHHPDQRGGFIRWGLFLLTGIFGWDLIECPGDGGAGEVAIYIRRCIVGFLFVVAPRRDHMKFNQCIII